MPRCFTENARRTRKETYWGGSPLVLFDQNLSFKLPKKLDQLYPGSSQVRLLGMKEADDPEIWEYARQHGFTLVTKDVNYYERSALLGHPPKVIWLRCGNQTTAFVERLLREHFTESRTSRTTQVQAA